MERVNSWTDAEMLERPERTRDYLARELRIVAEKASPANAAKYERLARRAETGEFDDYGNVHVCGPTALYGELINAGFTKFAKRVAAGEFDATRAESDEWANSPEGREAMGSFNPEQRGGDHAAHVVEGRAGGEA